MTDPAEAPLGKFRQVAPINGRPSTSSAQARTAAPLAATVDCPLALQHESELGEEVSRGREVVDHDADVLHPLDRHALDGKEPDSGPRPPFAWLSKRPAAVRLKGEAAQAP
jgi:hypothetical protein